MVGRGRCIPAAGPGRLMHTYPPWEVAHALPLRLGRPLKRHQVMNVGDTSLVLDIAGMRKFCRVVDVATASRKEEPETPMETEEEGIEHRGREKEERERG